MGIKVKHKVMLGDVRDVSFVIGETLDVAAERALKEVLDNSVLVGTETLQHFNARVNGNIIEHDLWDSILIREADDVILSVRLSGGGDNSQLLKTALLIVITVYTGGATAGLGAIGSALVTAGVSIAASMALNALIPPPEPEGLGAGGLGTGGPSESSMYSISGQSNTAKRYGSVPKTYGIHRTFPNIAAAPYTTLSAGKTGTLVQYYHAIYDFGHGPNTISDIRIGDTPITEYADIDFKLVDINKDPASTALWDADLNTEFQLYHGIVKPDNVGITFEEDYSPSLPADIYSAVRFTDPNVGNVAQSIELEFVCPQGLVAYGSDGIKKERVIEIGLEFRKVGDTTWRGVRDPAYVRNHSVVGNVTEVIKETLTLGTVGAEQIIGYSTAESRYIPGQERWTPAFPLTEYGYPVGTTILFFRDNIPISVGELLYEGSSTSVNTFIGQVAFSQNEGGGLIRVRLQRPTVRTILSYSRNTYYTGNPIHEDRRNTIIGHTKSISDSIAITATSTVPVYFSAKFTPREVGQFEIRVTRESSHSSVDNVVQDTLTWTTLTTRLDGVPIVTKNRHTFLEIRIKSTNQLNGAIQNLSATVGSIIPVFDGTDWNLGLTQNPAWVFADLLTGPINKKAIPQSQLDTDSLLEWAAFCEEVPDSPPGEDFIDPRFTSNFVLDYGTTLQSVLASVSSSAQSSLNLVDGKYGVLIDRDRTIPTQIFTPRNSWGFSSSRSYVELPHAFKVQYIDPNSDWEVGEELVYNDGYDFSNATKFEEIKTFACTYSEQAWRWGRYMMAQAALRKENISIQVDFEHLVCNRGDFVKITQDVMKVGGRPARVKTVVGDIVTLDDDIETIPTESYGMLFRTNTGEINTSTVDVIDSSTYQIFGLIPGVGDLVVVGVVDQLAIDCIVKSIEPDESLNATISLVEKAPAIYTAESTGVLPAYEPFLNTDTEGLSAPGPVENLLVIENDWRVDGRTYDHYMVVDWDLPLTGAADTFEVYVDSGSGSYDLFATTKDSIYEYDVDEANLGIEHFFKVLGVSANGDKKTLLEASITSATPLRKITPPSDLDGLFINLTNEVLQLDWTTIGDVDVNEYLIRYAPLESSTWESSIPLLRVDKNTTMATTQARTGLYLIKAIDFNFNESVNAQRAFTSIPNLINVNAIEETNDFPGTLGTRDRVVRAGAGGDSLILQTFATGAPGVFEFFNEGYYYYREFLDLGDIYTVRLQSLIRAEGYTNEDLMANWVTLASVAALANARYSEWDVESQVRYTNGYNLMSNWTTLSIIDPISEGVQDKWSDWKRFTQGDFTGRIFQYRLKLISNLPSVSPRVFDGVITADMPDRVDSYNNIISSISGTDVEYSPSFKGPGTSPAIQITSDNMETGDYYTISYKDLYKFTITFYDNNNIAVSRQFDAGVKGYGSRSDASI
tara:strand:- start:2975 stop:7225 length:4251 start_codon:yes stop_codon:yes gene_type:complete